MQLRGATATHVGNVRETNQDRAHFGGFVAAVADGMGGHQGGEMAASIAIKEFISIDAPIGPGGLVELVEDANRAVFERASDPDLRGMGTTLVAVALRPDEGKVSVVNVGDSRAYFFREGGLTQLTDDHSLVEDLVRQKRLTKEEALNHPQRNILTRALGIASNVEVDQFLVDVRLGDRFLLCSDGLFNEVDESEIARMLAEFQAPDRAAEHLVQAALAGAGRDNVTVAVVDVVADGQGGDLSSQKAETLLVPTIGVTTGEIEVTTEVAAAARTTQPAVAGVGVDVIEPEVGGGVQNRDRTLDPEPDPRMSALELDRLDESNRYDATDYPPVEVHEPKRSRVGLLVAVLGVLVLLAGIGYLGVSMYGNRGFFVGADGQDVAVFQGRPGGLLWVQPSLVDKPTGLTVDELSEADQVRVAAEQTFDSEEAAFTLVDELRANNQASDVGPESLDELENNAESGTSTSTTRTTTTSTTRPTTASTGVPPADGGADDGTGPNDGTSTDEASADIGGASGLGQGALAAGAAGTDTENQSGN